MTYPIHCLFQVCGVTDRKFTYAELRDHSAAFAVRLQSQFRFKQNDVVAVCLPNIPEFPIATLGAAEAGLIVTTVNPIYTPGAMRSIYIPFLKIGRVVVTKY